MRLVDLLVLHDDIIGHHWFIVIGWLFDMTHDCGHVVYVSHI